MVLAIAFFAFHITHLAPSLEDIDSVNFALAIHDFNPIDHRPHPPGYPIFVALTKLSSFVLAPDARAIAFWGVVFGALAVFPLAQLFAALEALRGRRDIACGFIHAAILLTITAPLFWFTAVRPLSDTTGLFISLAAQAALAAAFAARRQGAAVGVSGRLVVLGALLAGLAIGFRAQAAWLTMPLLIVVVLDRIGEDAAGAILGSVMMFSVGVLAWLVPMLIAVGQPAAYFTALLNQGGEDLTGVEMLATGFGARLAALSLWRSFIAPWEWNVLGWIVAVAALAGLAELAIRARAALVVVFAILVPYALFHLAFHETITIRYALPFVPVIVYLALNGVRLVGERASIGFAVAAAAASLWVAHPSVVAYGAAPGPVEAGFAEIARRQPAAEHVAGMHHAFLRSFQASGLKMRALPVPPKREWVELMSYWKSGDRLPLWFLAEPRRTDLALVDARARHLIGAYRWPFADDRLLGGARPSEMDLYEIGTPGWFAEEGFALTPPLAGLARTMNLGPSLAPIRAWVRPRAGEATLMIGGRHLGSADEAPVLFRATLGDREVGAWNVGPAEFFLQFFTISSPPAAATPYAPLEIRASSVSAAAGAVPITSVEQFDIQDRGSVVFGFGEGWHEPEYNPDTGALWRWMSARATVRLRHAGQPMTIHVRGESPLRYFDTPPVIVMRAGTRELSRLIASNDFTWSVRVPASALESPEGEITIETDRSFVPAEQASLRRSADRRRLGLRIYDVRIDERGRE